MRQNFTSKNGLVFYFMPNEKRIYRKLTEFTSISYSFHAVEKINESNLDKFKNPYYDEVDLVEHYTDYKWALNKYKNLKNFL